MSTDYQTTHQYEPLRAPESWHGDERGLIVQLTQIFDDLYRRFNRLRFEDLGKAMRSRIEDGEGNISQIKQTATELSAVVAGVDGALAELSLSTEGLVAAVDNNRLVFTAEGLTIKNAAGVTVFQQESGEGNLTISGNITATSGVIGGFTIGDRTLHNGTSIMLSADGYVRLGKLTVTDEENTGPVLSAEGGLSLRVGSADVLKLAGSGVAAQFPLDARFGLSVDPNQVTTNPPNAYIDPVTGRLYRSTAVPAGSTLRGGLTLYKASITLGDPAILQASAEGGTLPYAYVYDVSMNGGEYEAIWSEDGTCVHVAQAVGTYRYRLTVSDGAGNRDVLYSEPVEVQPQMPLSVTISANKSTVAGSGEVTWTAQAQGGSGQYTYRITIYRELEIYTVITQPTATVTLSQPGEYWAAVDVYGQEGDGSAYAASAKVTVTATYAYAYTTSGYTPIYQGPGTATPVVFTIKQTNSFVQIQGQAVGGFYPVYWQGYAGYIQATALRIT